MLTSVIAHVYNMTFIPKHIELNLLEENMHVCMIMNLIFKLCANKTKLSWH